MSYQYNGQMAPPPPAYTGQMVNDVRPVGAASGTAAAVAQTAAVMAGREILVRLLRAATGK
ncbi:hypothetical protein ABZ208_37215 [Streptomyces sp. NPDC006208]|uniref:hypothetical protein n=1 Tax=Streptomyces sp. NPDC006208 TaxID=3156734 RepID=UPI0033BF1CD2